MIGVDSPTPLDLRFPLGPIPVRVSVLFWVFMALIGWSFCEVASGNQWVNLLIWVACAFVSILVHELGHAVAYRAFGSWASITLHTFGGQAQATEAPRAAWQRLIVAASGPAAGLVLAGLVFLIQIALASTTLDVYVKNAIGFLLWVNVVWSIFNLFPIPPLDGGSVCRELLAIFGARNPDLYAHGVGFVLALLLAVSGGLRIAGLLPSSVFGLLPDWVTPWIRPSMFRTLWYAVLAFHNFQLMQMVRRQRNYGPPDDYDDDTPPWRRR